MYNNCNECPHNNKESCPLAHQAQHIRQQICQFVKLPLIPFHEPIKWFDIKELPIDFPEVQETQYSYTEFFHMAFAAETNEQQARYLQNVLVATAAIAGLRKEDITMCRFFISESGEARALMPSEI